MKCFLVFGLVVVIGAAVSSANDEPSFFDELMREVKKQQKANEGKSITELATKFIDDLKSVGKEFTSILRDAASPNSAESPEKVKPKADKDKTILEIVTELLAAESQQQSADGKARQKRDTDNKDISALLQQLLSQHGASSKSEDESASASDSESHAAASYDGSSSPSGTESSNVSTRLGNPAPIVLIPGPPGKPGLPGLPGIPGKNGKIPNFRGLKAILTTRVAELLAFLTVVAVASVIKFLGLLGLLLGLVLPIYGKLKKAGVLVPGDAPAGYQQPSGYQQPGYARRKRAVPMDNAFPLHGLFAHVMENLEVAEAKMR